MKRVTLGPLLLTSFLVSLGVPVSPHAVAQPPSAKGQGAQVPDVVPPSSAPGAADPKANAATGTPASNGPAQTLTVPGRNLMMQRLHPASFPQEAEIRCSILEFCAAGLTRGFVLGSDLLYGTVGTTFLGSQIYAPGAWLFYDGFLGYQFLQGVDNKFYANGSIGYRGFSYRKEVGSQDDERTVRSRGFTFRVAYGQEITPVYSQGLTFEIFAGKTTMDESEFLLLLNEDGQAARKFARQFYEYSQHFPKVRLGLPADFEIINWKATHIDLPNHLRGYVRAEPFYIQNEFAIEDRYTSTEKNFGLRAKYMMSYESKQEKAGRYAVLVGVGFDLATSNKPEATYEGEGGDDDRLKAQRLKPRKVFQPLLNVEASYQF
ncbi:MAG: hypothetical protein IOD12_06025 [Silvanigrellales bacterium]|nr:hypothetical protein [Silvanigrellales bacterium]